MLFFATPPPPVSYSRQVAPIFALHCNGCHGDDGGLGTRSHAGLMRGGNLGKVVIPGDAESSLLVHFLEGRRGEAHRMPLGGRPLSPVQIETIRRWIAEGATNDAAVPPKRTLKLAKVSLAQGRILRVFCRVDTESYLTMTVRDSRNQRTLFEAVASIKSPKERVDAGEPGELIWWDITAGKGWPKSVSIDLTIQYAAAEPQDVQFFTRLIDRS
jgi:mono/diheme cytochrome c family protein